MGNAEGGVKLGNAEFGVRKEKWEGARSTGGQQFGVPNSAFCIYKSSYQLLRRRGS